MDDNLEILDELQIDESEFELIIKQQSYRYSFPVVGIRNGIAFFNKYAVKLIPDHIKWFTTSEYVIGLAADEKDKDSYKTRKVWNEVVAHLPTNLRKHKKMRDGHYKVYKYKDGFAFKRYEQLDENVK